jgi:hypothetical protein
MQITFDLPEELAERFAADVSGLSRAALEALALEGIRSGNLTVAEGRRMLGISSRYEMDGFLKDHHVYLDVTVDDVLSDAQTALSFTRTK